MLYGTIQYPIIAQPVGDPSDWIEPVFYEGWQNPAAALMPIYDPRFLAGDIANMPALFLVLSNFSEDGTGDVSGTLTFDILEGPTDFEIRTPI